MNPLQVPWRRHSRAGMLVVIPLLAASCTAAAPPSGPPAASPPPVSPTTVATTTPTTVGVSASTTNGPAAVSTTTEAVAARPSGAIIVDHTATDPAAIPDHWLVAAQETVLWAYGSTSHGTQLLAGARYLADHDPQLGFAGD
ncbi:MAG: hypothetical protein KJ956_07955, partial [Actinobacteria bacterium]|nr:hypothetical protein [Actinomycetota bacterium]